MSAGNASKTSRKTTTSSYLKYIFTTVVVDCPFVFGCVTLKLPTRSIGCLVKSAHETRHSALTGRPVV